VGSDRGGDIVSDEEIRVAVKQKIAEAFTLLNQHTHGSDLQGHLLANVQRSLATADRDITALHNALTRRLV